MTDCSCSKKPTEIAAEPLAGVAEPLMGIAEDPRYDVIPCTPCTTGSGSPTAVRFERATKTVEGYSYQTLRQEELPRKLAKAYAARESCLPWVRVQRDPDRFRACLARAAKVGPMDDPKNVASFLGDYLTAQDQEVFLVVLLDTQLAVRGVSEIVRGARDGVEVPIPDVLRIVLVEGATAFVVVHNHPSGRNVNPSDADKELTKAIALAGKQVGVQMLDHVIVGAKTFYSFAAHNLL